MPDHADPFRDARQTSGVQPVNCDGEEVALVLRLQDVRKAANDWKTFSSDHPFMVVLHSEKDVRSVRQLPIEIDPPDHTDYRRLVEPLFRKPTQPDYQAKIAGLIDQAVAAAVAGGPLEAVQQLALPIQSRALAELLGMPASEADLWIKWGVHVFHDGGNGAEKGLALEKYIHEQLALAPRGAGDDFFSLLNAAQFRGRPLTLEEKTGFGSVTFAGGRDTIINTVSSLLVYLGEHPEALAFLRSDEAHIMTATEEFVRYVSPLTAIARTCPHGASVAGAAIAPGQRIGLCWPSANRDSAIFTNPDQVVLDRKPNPHVGFGFGPHNCLGAPQARLIIRSLLKSLCARVNRVEVTRAVPKMEHESSFSRQVGYERVDLRLS